MLFTACKDKDAEKKIAALEARLSELEGKKPAPVSVTPMDNPVPEPDTKPEGPLPVIQFEKIDHDFGTIPQGKEVSFTYKFKNTGEAPLIIQSAQPTCGCTVSDYSKEPIPVGGTGFVTAAFDGKAAGMQNKSVTVTANTWPKSTVLTFKAMVTPTSEAQGPAK
ncbi:MAG: DUF1573 domain-containing protein [Cyclobacteriaceae bacterium]|nr:DUF1573 domain-containing protein [Cyclobacteriaceae bacterium]